MGRSSPPVAGAIPWGRASGPAGLALEALQERGCSCKGFYTGSVLTVYFGAPSMFIILWFGFDYGTNPPLGTLII
jgi:hypothetical protein